MVTCAKFTDNCHCCTCHAELVSASHCSTQLRILGETQYNDYIFVVSSCFDCAWASKSFFLCITVWNKLYIFSLLITVICFLFFIKSTEKDPPPLKKFADGILIFTIWNSPLLSTLRGSLKKVSNVFLISNLFFIRLYYNLWLNTASVRFLRIIMLF